MLPNELVKERSGFTSPPSVAGYIPMSFTAVTYPQNNGSILNDGINKNNPVISDSTFP